MGQYWYPVNLDKKEFVHPHKLGSGLKLWEQLANHPGTGAVLVILMAAMPETRGGGDFDLERNWHGPERTFPKYSATSGPMPTEYPAIASATIGRWAGDRIALVGDYAEEGDLPNADASKIYALCCTEEDDLEKYPEDYIGITKDDLYTDITDMVRAVIEHELCGKFVGDGWCDFVYDGDKED